MSSFFLGATGACDRSAGEYQSTAGFGSGGRDMGDCWPRPRRPWPVGADQTAGSAAESSVKPRNQATKPDAGDTLALKLQDSAS